MKETYEILNINEFMYMIDLICNKFNSCHASVTQSTYVNVTRQHNAADNSVYIATNDSLTIEYADKSITIPATHFIKNKTIYNDNCLFVSKSFSDLLFNRKCTDKISKITMLIINNSVISITYTLHNGITIRHQFN